MQSMLHKEKINEWLTKIQNEEKYAPHIPTTLEHVIILLVIARLQKLDDQHSYTHAESHSQPPADPLSLVV